MLKQFIFLLGVIILACGCSPSVLTKDYSEDVFPTPSEIIHREGALSLKKDLKIGIMDSTLLPAATYLQKILASAAPQSEVITGIGDLSFIHRQEGEKEGTYHLEITPNNITITAGDYSGFINGISTFRQLLPPEIELTDYKAECVLPVIIINDTPEFTWRGLMVDAARHFWNKEEVKQVLDMMALYKLNKFHWHLTDDQGWRVEIKQYPLLTEKGAWRTYNKHDSICMQKAVQQDNSDFLLPENKLKITERGDTLYGGYYTQDDIREIVSYATQRGIEVIPEIDMPGHFLAAINQYPDVACTGLIGWGTMFSSPICPGKDSSIRFCQNVYKEIFGLFPSKYIHLGADEVEKTNWSKCTDCQQQIKKEHLKDVNQLQAWFVRQMEMFCKENGKKVIGWDEVIKDGLSDEATIMWWRSWMKDAAQQTAQQGKEVILCPNYTFYFDYDQDKNTINQILTFNPYETLNENQHKFVKGIQANIWAEKIPSLQRLQYMLAPRILALSEVAWGQKKPMDETTFYQKATPHFLRFNYQKVNYRIPNLKGFYDRNACIETDTLTLISSIPNIKIRYTTDGSMPDQNSMSYEKPLLVNATTNYLFRTFRPDGTPCDVTSTSFVCEPYSKACPSPNQLKGGLEALWYDFRGDSCSQITTVPLKGKYIIEQVSIPSKVKGNIGLVITGFIDIPKDDIYTFAICSDDGSIMTIDGTPILLNDGPHSPKEYIGQAALSKGLHPVEIRYFDHNGGVLELYLIDQNGEKVEIPKEWFKHSLH